MKVANVEGPVIEVIILREGLDTRARFVVQTEELVEVVLMDLQALQIGEAL